MIRVLVVDDSPSVRMGIRFVLESDPELKVIGEARTGEDSVKLCRRLQPDIVTMDIMMPGMGGYEAIRQIMSESPCPVIVLTGVDSQGLLDVSFKALKLGALTVVQKPQLLYPDNAEAKHLISQIKRMASVKVVRRSVLPGSTPLPPTNGITPPVAPVRHVFLQPAHRGIRLVAIGASTGGPPALETILGALPSNFPLPIMIVQHISRGFVSGLANWLSKVTPFQCKVGEQGEVVRSGAVYLAPDDAHMTVKANGAIWLDPSDPIGSHRPSVTALFESVARNFKSAAIGILLTGMGKDGAQGLKDMRQAGAHTIAQDEASSVVFGMPGVAVELDAVDEVLGLNLIAPWLKGLAENIIERKE